MEKKKNWKFNLQVTFYNKRILRNNYFNIWSTLTASNQKISLKENLLFLSYDALIAINSFLGSAYCQLKCQKMDTDEKRNIQGNKISKETLKILDWHTYKP
jgi:hypothetical protein